MYYNSLSCELTLISFPTVKHMFYTWTSLDAGFKWEWFQSCCGRLVVLIVSGLTLEDSSQNFEGPSW
jgi:hypothetical protein